MAGFVHGNKFRRQAGRVRDGRLPGEYRNRLPQESGGQSESGEQAAHESPSGRAAEFEKFLAAEKSAQFVSGGLNGDVYKRQL